MWCRLTSWTSLVFENTSDLGAGTSSRCRPWRRRLRISISLSLALIKALSDDVNCVWSAPCSRCRTRTTNDILLGLGLDSSTITGKLERLQRLGMVIFLHRQSKDQYQLGSISDRRYRTYVQMTQMFESPPKAFSSKCVSLESRYGM